MSMQIFVFSSFVRVCFVKINICTNWTGMRPSPWETVARTRTCVQLSRCDWYRGKFILLSRVTKFGIYAHAQQGRCFFFFSFPEDARDVNFFIRNDFRIAISIRRLSNFTQLENYTGWNVAEENSDPRLSQKFVFAFCKIACQLLAIVPPSKVISSDKTTFCCYS